MTMIATKTSRRTIRSRVFAARETVVSLTRDATRVARRDHEAVDDEGDRERDQERDRGRDPVAVGVPEASLPRLRSCQSSARR